MITKHDKEQAERYVRGEDVSDTPRSDSEQEHASNIALYISTGKHGYTENEAMVVPLKFAQQLERELTAAKAHLADANKGARINALVNQELVTKNQQLMAQRDQWQACAEALVEALQAGVYPAPGSKGVAALSTYTKLKAGIL